MPRRAASEPYHYDPVCGRRVRGEGETSASAEHSRQKYFFCSERCRMAFERQAERLRLGDIARAGALLSPGKVSWGIA